MPEPEFLEPTRKIALKVWWALAWRFGACVALIALLQGFLLGLCSAAFALQETAIDTASGALTAFVGFPLVLAASLECVYRVLGKKLGGVAIALIGTPGGRSRISRPAKL